MFLENSRYARVPTVAVALPDGREVTAVTLRRLPATDGEAYTTAGGDRLDLLAFRRYADPTRYWHVADANTELRAPLLTAAANRTIRVPEH
ncbi:MAG TPA: hypothetical protein VF541_07665 [Longimicrobium sp.]